MKKKIFAVLAVFAGIFSAVGVDFAQTKGKNSNQLLPLLPPSDAVVAIDAKRLFNDALPKILDSNQPLLTEILAKFDEIKAKTGIDYKQFQQVAVGVSSINVSDKGYEFEPLVLARGQFNSTALMTAAKIASNGKYREEKIGERTVYVFSLQENIEQNKAKINNSKFADYLNKFLTGLNKEMALTTYDGNTLVLGSLVRVSEMFESKTRISPEVLGLASRKPGALVNFGAVTPNGVAGFLDLDDDEIGRNLGGVRQLYGSVDMAGGGAVVSIVARTLDPKQAEGLKETIMGFQALAGILKGSKREDQKIYGRMLENVKIGQTGNELTIDLQVPQSDINVLVGAKK